jgi:hypothetical protein
MGLSWNWQHREPTADAYSTVLGSDLNARIDWGFYLRYRSTPRTSLYTGIDFTHRSNAGMVQPDKGVNVIGPKIAMEYDFGRGGVGQPRAPQLPAFRPRWDILAGGSGGVKNVLEKSSPTLRQDFGVFHGTVALQQQFYRFGRIEAGSDLAYDGATGARGDFVNGVVTQWRANPGERWAVGVYGGYEHLIGRFSAFVDLGYNVARGAVADASTPRLYQRFGWRYRVNDRVWSTLSVRSTEGRKADSLEVGAGYRFHLSGDESAR